MWHPLAIALVLGIGSTSSAQADKYRDCSQTRDPDRQIRACTKIIENQREYKDNRAGGYLNRGIAYRAKGEPDRAIADFTQAIKLNPRASAYNTRGTAYGDKGEYDAAIADFTKAIELDPQDAKAYGNRGSAYHAKGETERAIAEYRKALSIDPTHERSREGLSRLRVAQ